MLSHIIQFFIVAPAFFVLGTIWNYVHTIKIPLSKADVTQSFTEYCNKIDKCEKCKYNNNKRRTSINDSWCYCMYLLDRRIELVREEEI